MTAEVASTEAQQPASGPAGPLATRSSFYDDSTQTGQVGMAFKRAMVAVRRLRGRETQRIGQLSYAQYGLLHGLSERCECSARDLAEHSNLSPATVTQMLEHLEAAGLVTRTRSEQDRRVVLSVLTDRGAAIVAERQLQMEARWTDALQEFSEADLAAATKVLNRVADLFESLSHEAPAQ
jgi:MarR family transcriptional regulator, organic hydroperoxide resistance regulator